MPVGANIRQRRYELRMTQQELADAMGYKCRATIARIESGENDVSQSKIKKFAAVLSTTVDALILGSDIINSSAAIPILPMESKSGRIAAIILAGGKSSRNEQNIPNQFITVRSKPVIVYSMEAYQHHPSVDDIYVVCIHGWESVVTAYAERFGITKLKGIISSGTTGALSIKNGFDSIRSGYSENDIVIYQESTRPMVSVEIVSKLIQSCNALDSANICMPMRDHLMFSITDGVETVPDRESTVEVQSPEAYRFRILDRVFEKAEKLGHTYSESCGAMLLHDLGFYINFVEGSISNNTKIIRQEDIAFFEAQL